MKKYTWTHNLILIIWGNPLNNVNKKISGFAQIHPYLCGSGLEFGKTHPTPAHIRPYLCGLWVPHHFLKSESHPSMPVSF
jgi:hypothetical protein